MGIEATLEATRRVIQSHRENILEGMQVSLGEPSQQAEQR